MNSLRVTTAHCKAADYLQQHTSEISSVANKTTALAIES